MPLNHKNRRSVSQKKTKNKNRKHFRGIKIKYFNEKQPRLIPGNPCQKHKPHNKKRAYTSINRQ